MLTANTPSHGQVISWQTEKDKGPFFCPQCGTPVILKKGTKIIHHFAHQKDSDCAFGAGETVEHMTVKRTLYEALSTIPNCTNWAMERYVYEGVVRPDLSGRINGVPVVIEVQRSNLNYETVARRFEEYSKHKIAMLWVLTNRFNQPTTRLADWKRYLKSIYSECLYVHHQGSILQSVRLEKETFSHDSYFVHPAGYVDISKDFSALIVQPFEYQHFKFSGGLVFQPKQDVSQRRAREEMKKELEAIENERRWKGYDYQRLLDKQATIKKRLALLEAFIDPLMEYRTERVQSEEEVRLRRALAKVEEAILRHDQPNAQEVTPPPTES